MNSPELDYQRRDHMFTYACLFCGVTHRTPRRITARDICGQTVDAGWLQEEPHEPRTERVSPEVSGLHRSPTLRAVA
jgi:hypothetical protein